MKRPLSINVIATLATCSICLSFFSVGIDASASEPDKQAFFTEYPRFAEKLERFYSVSQGSGTLSRVNRVGTPDESKEEFNLNFWLNNGQMRLDKSWSLASGGREVGTTTAYVTDTSSSQVRSLRLDRIKPESTYVLKYMGLSTEDCDYNIYDQLGRFVSAPYAIDGEPISRLMGEPTFKILNVSTQKRGEHDVVKVEFDFRPRFPRPQTLGGGISEGFEHLEGQFNLVPSDGWCLLDSEIKMTRKKGLGTFIKTSRIEYGERVDGFPLIQKVVLEWKEAKPLRHTLQLTSNTHVPSPPQKFKAAEFGFPELDVNESDNTAYIMLFISAITLILAIFFHSWRNRSRRSTGNIVSP